LLGCEPSPVQEKTVTDTNESRLQRPAEDALTHTRAKARKSWIGEIHYSLFFVFGSKQDNFAGRVLIDFAPIKVSLQWHPHLRLVA